MSKAEGNRAPTLKFGWVPDVPDRRDFMLKGVARVTAALHPAVDISGLTGPVLNQGSLGSCTAFATLAAFYAASVPAKLRVITTNSNTLRGFPSTVAVRTLSTSVSRQLDLSELFQYYESRRLHDTLAEDSGASIRNAIKSVGKIGVCTEATHPYADTTNAMIRPPTQAAYTEAAKFKALKYERVDNKNPLALYSALSLGKVIVFGSMLYESFMDTKNVVKMPTKKEKSLGGHAMAAVGYDSNAKRFLVKNSWGRGWALNGYHWMPEAYLTDTNMSDDFWTMTTVSIA